METKNAVLDFANSKTRSFPGIRLRPAPGWLLRMHLLDSRQFPCGRLAGGGRCDYNVRAFRSPFFMNEAWWDSR
jgi:hypothetical protein